MREVLKPLKVRSGSNVGKAFNLPSDIFKQLTIGVVGYAQWQTTDNQVNVSATTLAESTVIHRLKELKTQIYAGRPWGSATNQVRPFRLALL